MLSRLIGLLFFLGIVAPSLAINAEKLFEPYASVTTYHARGKLSEEALRNTEQEQGAFEIFFERGKGWRVEHGDEIFVFDGNSLLVRFPRMNSHVLLEFDSQRVWKELIEIQSPATTGLQYHPVFALLEGLNPVDWKVAASDEKLRVQSPRTSDHLPWGYLFQVHPERGLHSTRYGVQSTDGPSWVSMFEMEEFGARINSRLFETSPPPNSFDLTDQLIRGNAADVHPLPGKPAPHIEGMVRGQVTLLDFWAIWCPPCLEGLPELNKHIHRLAEDVQIIGVNTDTDSGRIQKAKNFVEAKGIGFPQVFAGNSKIIENYSVETLPMMVIVRPDGIVHDVHVGELQDLETLTRLIEDARRASSLPD